MTKLQYNLYIRVIKAYLKLEGYKVKRLKHSQPSHKCNKCGGLYPATKLGILFPFSEKVLVFYVSRCETCKIAYLYGSLEVLENDIKTTD